MSTVIIRSLFLKSEKLFLFVSFRETQHHALVILKVRIDRRTIFGQFLAKTLKLPPTINYVRVWGFLIRIFVKNKRNVVKLTNG